MPTIEEQQSILLDPEIRDWVLIPIMLVMFLVGILRDNIQTLLTSNKNQDEKTVREK